MIKGNLLASTNYEDIAQASQAGFKILFVGDTLDSPTNIQGIISAVPFTPDYKALSTIIDGNIDAFDEMYVEGLRSASASELIAIIIMALVNGTNILMYFPPDVMQLRYPYILKQYLERYHGLIFEFDARTFKYNPNFNFINTRIVYLFNMIDVLSFINASDGEQYDAQLLNKLRIDIHNNLGANTNISDRELLILIDNIRHSKGVQHQQNQQVDNQITTQTKSNVPTPPKKRKLFEKAQVS